MHNRGDLEGLAGKGTPRERIPSWLAHIILATMFAGVWAAVPFWVRGLPLSIAEVLAAIIFPAVIVGYILLMRKTQ